MRVVSYAHIAIMSLLIGIVQEPVCNDRANLLLLIKPKLTPRARDVYAIRLIIYVNIRIVKCATHDK